MTKLRGEALKWMEEALWDLDTAEDLERGQVQCRCLLLPAGSGEGGQGRVIPLQPKPMGPWC